MAKKPTGGLIRGKKKTIKSKNGQKTPTGGLIKGEKRKIMCKNGKKIPGGKEPEIPIN